MPAEPCPTCGGRRRVLPAALLASLVAGLLVLAGVWLMLGAFGDALDEELDDQVTRVERNFDRDLSRLRREVRTELRRELDVRLP